MGSKWDKLSRNLMVPTSEADIKRLGEYEEEGRLAGRLSKMPDLSQLSKFGTEVQEWHREWLVEAFRVLQPGGVIKAFSATRTWHRLAAAMEEAGFVDIHLEAWTYGSGFPKSLNIGKALDRAAGAEREVVGSVFLTGNAAQTTKEKGGTYAAGTDARGVPAKEVMITAPATDEAKKWDGFGTAVKPAWEPIVVGRKP